MVDDPAVLAKDLEDKHEELMELKLQDIKSKYHQELEEKVRLKNQLDKARMQSATGTARAVRMATRAKIDEDFTSALSPRSNEEPA